MHQSADIGYKPGIQISTRELIQLRPYKNVTGFAPAGKVNCQNFGLNPSFFRGRGMEFDESRIYQPGDDVKCIDWRVTARTGKVHSKLFQEERERPVYILLDTRRMMHFGTRVCFKSVMAAKIAAILSWVAVDGGDSIGISILQQQAVTHFSATRNHSSMLRYLKAMSDATTFADDSVTQKYTLSQCVKQLRHRCQSGALVFIVSDFHDLCEETESQLKMLAQKTSVTNILIFDQLDEYLPDGGNFRISDGNTALALQNLGQKQKDHYQSAFTHRTQRLTELSAHLQIGFLRLSTADDPGKVISRQKRSHPSIQSLRQAA